MHGILRRLFLGYFITHIPITILIDLQGAFPEYYPQPIRNVVLWYIETFGDFLMGTGPVWFRSFLYCKYEDVDHAVMSLIALHHSGELAMQLPFFLYVIHGILIKSNSIRIPCIVYGSHVSTTVVPILMEFAFSKVLTVQRKLWLIGIYSPYLLVPITLTIYMLLNPEPFSKDASNSKKKA
jgi:hypothetical protein